MTTTSDVNMVAAWVAVRGSTSISRTSAVLLSQDTIERAVSLRLPFRGSVGRR